MDELMCEYKDVYLEPRPNKATVLEERHQKQQAEWYIITEKKRQLRTIIKNTNSPVLVVCRHTDSRFHVYNEFMMAKVFECKESMLNDWNARKIPIMVIMEKDAVQGMKMHQGGNTVVWYDEPSSPQAYAQANARLIRLGQTEKVMVYNILSQTTKTMMNAVLDSCQDIQKDPYTIEEMSLMFTLASINESAEHLRQRGSKEDVWRYIVNKYEEYIPTYNKWSANLNGPVSDSKSNK